MKMSLNKTILNNLFLKILRVESKDNCKKKKKVGLQSICAFLIDVSAC